jgi:hypothetical protein
MQQRERWRRVVLWSLLATVLAGTVVLLAVQRAGLPITALTEPGARGPSAAAFRADFPGAALPDGGGHDGQQFYAIARDPLHLDKAAPLLDRPRYRLQRIAYPVLAWALHPGGGKGTIVALFGVGCVAMFLGCLATGALATGRGAPPWTAALFAVVPGNLAALRMSTADTLALAAAVAAIALCERRRPGLAIALGALAALSKESMIVVLLAYAIARRDRISLSVAGAAIAVATGWAVWLHLTVATSGPQVVELTAPFRGLAQAASHWLNGEEPVAALIVLATAALVVLALVRRPDRFTRCMVGLTAAFVTFLSADATGLWGNASRITAPTMLFAAVALAAPRAEPDPPQGPSPPGRSRQGEIVAAQ